MVVNEPRGLLSHGGNGDVVVLVLMWTEELDSGNGSLPRSGIGGAKHLHLRVELFRRDIRPLFALPARCEAEVIHSRRAPEPWTLRPVPPGRWEGPHPAAMATSIGRRPLGTDVMAGTLESMHVRANSGKIVIILFFEGILVMSGQVRGFRSADGRELVTPGVRDPFLLVLSNHLIDVAENNGGCEVLVHDVPSKHRTLISKSKVDPRTGLLRFHRVGVTDKRVLGELRAALVGVAGAAIRSNSRFVAPISPIAFGWKNARFLQEMEGEQGLTSM